MSLESLRTPATTLAIVTLAASALVAPAAYAQSTDAGTLTLRSAQLTVTVAEEFPRVLGYVDNATGATMGGQPAALDTVVINGTPRKAVLDGAPAVNPDGSAATYALTFADLPGVRLETSIGVRDRVATFKVDKVTDTGAARVNTVEIPNHSLVSVSSDQSGAATAFTTLSADSTTTADRFGTVTAATPVQTSPSGATYAILNTAKLAAAIESNSSYDRTSSSTSDDRSRFLRQTTKDAGGTVRVGVWSGQWTYRGTGAPYTEALPYAKVVITPDANEDGTVDWQDGAVAFRDIMVRPLGAEETKNRVIPHIPFNFASQATHPFLRTLDDVKRVSLSTDGLGQWALLKGYGSEGHDSAHPDYGGNYNTRAGGLKDLNTLLREGKKWGADFAVHVNATESYPEAKSFNETLVDKARKGWNWIDQSYLIDQRRDLTSGDVARRFQQLRDETDPNLSSLYIDVYYSSGWLADSLAAKLREQGWQIGTEWSYRHERDALWSHWAADRNYGGATNKGLNSKIIRFVRNHEKDVWNADPILGNATIEDFEGWTGETDWNVFYRNIWDNNLPAKFLQHHEIKDWNSGEIVFTGGVRGVHSNGARQLYVGGAKVLDGKKYLLPWRSTGATTEDKLYHYNPDGGRTTWRVPAPFARTSSFAVYRLTDHGRVKVTDVKVSNGRITVDARAGQPYVLYPGGAPAPAAVNWGQGSHLADPGFNDSKLDAWNPSGEVSLARLGNGAGVAQLGQGAAGIGQTVSGLTGGSSYTASAWIEIAPGATRDTMLEVRGATAPASVTVRRSPVRNLVAADEKHGTYFQRAKVHFTVPEGADSVALSLRAADGTAAVRVDDFRVVRSAEPKLPGAVVFEDFEDVDQGWGPFVKGDAGGTTDPRTHLSERNEPYTQAGWNGKLVDDVLGGDWSLKAHEENPGLVYRTAPWTVDFKDGHAYEVSFRYANGQKDYYSWIRGVDRISGGKPTQVELASTPIGQQRTPATFTQRFVAGCGGDTWVGLRKGSDGGSEADFVLDDFTVRDLGPSAEAPDCASSGISGAALGGMAVGEPNPVTTSFTNNGAEPVTGLTLSLAGPDGWTSTATTPATFTSVAPGTTVRTTWDVTPPAGTTTGAHKLTLASDYTVGGKQVTGSTSAEVNVLPAGQIPQWRLKVAGYSSADDATEGQAAKAIDGDRETLWHTAWSQVEPDPNYPHFITLDLGQTYRVDGLRYLPRQTGVNGRIKGYQVFVSADGQTWGEPVASGQFPDTTQEQELTFAATSGRFVKLVALSSLNGGPWAAAAELNVHGVKSG